MVAGIIGATGYAGAELVRILSGHPHIDKLSLSSVSFEGDRIEKVYPNFLGRVSAVLEKADAVIMASDVVFASLPNGVGEPYARAAAEKGIPYIDLSADFRFDDDEETYTAWYGKPYLHPELHKISVYGLPELNRKRIQELAVGAAQGKPASANGKPGPVIIGNPGCYPTATSLGAFPVLARGIAAPGATIIADAASGVTGGGRDPVQSFHYPECADSAAPYKVGAHRHTPEISRNMAFMAARSETGGVDSGKGIAPNLIFTPHLVPMNRGILSTIYIPLAESRRPGGVPNGAPRPPSKEIAAKTDEIRTIYADFYKDEPFVRVLPAGVFAATNRVRQSNFCDISVHIDQAGTTLIIVSAIDNMVKGAAGQAVQNMNIIFGYDETSGLGAIPALF
ncbi:N-acetyl-gamma-glutamyl-phosphate reductase [Spirochaetia bacterium]|nr:N-acetyl-gamma-glutamyl-phosphate reductase [Spirochaetia bacterium]